jgi:hypothetical protein
MPNKTMPPDPPDNETHPLDRHSAVELNLGAVSFRIARGGRLPGWLHWMLAALVTQAAHAWPLLGR